MKNKENPNKINKQLKRKYGSNTKSIFSDIDNKQREFYMKRRKQEGRAENDNESL